MPKKAKNKYGYKELSGSLASGEIGCLYIFHGDERYLLQHSLAALRRSLCPDGLGSFNYRRFEGRGFDPDELSAAVNTLPAFAERTLIEVHDFDVMKSDTAEKLIGIFSDIPEYACVVFVYDAMPYKPDGRLKITGELLKYANVIEFAVQEQDKLIKWIGQHFASAGKRISPQDSEYLAFITGGYMSALLGEIGKVSAYAKAETVTRRDIDAVASPVLDAVVYKMTDALAKRDHGNAMKMLGELLEMREEPHKLLYSISLKIRQLLAARVCVENGMDKSALMEMCGLRHEFIARPLMDTARRMTLSDCRKAVLNCSAAAYGLNSAPEPEARLTELVARLALS